MQEIITPVVEFTCTLQAFTESPPPSAEIDVDEIMAYSPYAANPKQVQRSRNPAAMDSDRVFVFRRGDTLLDNPADPGTRQSFASQRQSAQFNHSPQDLLA